MLFPRILKMKAIEEIRDLKKIFNDRIYSIIKYGFGKRNILVVLDDITYEYLTEIKLYIAKLRKKKNIVVISKKDIKPKNLGVDFLNIKLTSVIIYGKDIFKDIDFESVKIKRQIRYEANNTLMNLRNELINKKWAWQMKELLFSAIPRLLPLIVAHLYIKGEKIPNAIPDTINRYLKHNEDAVILLKISKSLTKEEMTKLFQELFVFLENLADNV